MVASASLTHGGVVTERTILAEVANSVYATQHNVTAEDLAAIWTHLNHYLCLSLKAARAVTIPGLGVFRVCHRFHANHVYPSEALYPVFHFHVRYAAQKQELIPREQHHVDGAAHPPNYPWLEANCGLPVQRTKRMAAELVRMLSKHILAGRSLNVEFDQVGKMQRCQKDRTLRFVFYSDLLWPPLPEQENPVVAANPRDAWGTQAASRALRTKAFGRPAAPSALKEHITGGGQARGSAHLLRKEQRMPAGLARVWEACLKEDRVRHGYIKRILMERFLQSSSRSILNLIGGMAVLDLLEKHACSTKGEFVRYQPLLLDLLEQYIDAGGCFEESTPRRTDASILDSSTSQDAVKATREASCEPMTTESGPSAPPQASGRATVRKEALCGGGCLVQRDAGQEAGENTSRESREIWGQSGPRRVTEPRSLHHSGRRVDTAVGYHPDVSGQKQLGFVDWESPEMDRETHRRMNQWNLEHSERVRRMRAAKGVTPKPNTRQDDTRHIMETETWAAPRAPPPAPRTPPAAQEHPDVAPGSPGTDPRRHFIKSCGKFEGEFGMRDEELVGRMRPHAYQMGFKRPHSSPAHWPERREVDHYNQQIIKEKEQQKRGPLHASIAEPKDILGASDSWGDVTAKVTTLGREQRYQTQYNACRRPPIARAPLC